MHTLHTDVLVMHGKLVSQNYGDKIRNSHFCCLLFCNDPENRTGLEWWNGIVECILQGVVSHKSDYVDHGSEIIDTQTSKIDLLSFCSTPISLQKVDCCFNKF